MNKSEIIRGIALRSRVGTDDVGNIVNDFLRIIEISLSCGEDVKLSGFGRFEVRDRAAAKRRNPRTGETVLVPPKRRVSFHPSATFKDRINAETEEGDSPE